ncbi:hypothetical protein HK099_003559 [Clydaea vesicula]|uniref:Leucine carboxyl methyltransferase 1 n=1 Tax=Clydaea vesicula TaxID=447962 RepID=A0AAD5Y0V4_9FUNG|nr:hypothetical protein HK099_003559 [Clydaea vesicula]KAJ3390071.1 hypothetical protein HDU92_000662 [Lobulomyces angularis]
MFNDKKDEAIRSTNDDAAQSRFSASSLGYFKDPYANAFVKRAIKRPPVINRGTYVRHTILNKMIRQFYNQHCNSKEKCNIQVVSFGAGSDTRFFQMKEEGFEFFKYFEIDFPEITIKKASVILKNKELTAHIGKYKFGNCEIVSEVYNLVSGDLRDFTHSVAPKLMRLGFSKSIPTIYVSECVLIYMEPKYSDKILRWVTSKEDILEQQVIFADSNDYSEENVEGEVIPQTELIANQFSDGSSSKAGEVKSNGDLSMEIAANVENSGFQNIIYLKGFDIIERATNINAAKDMVSDEITLMASNVSKTDYAKDSILSKKCDKNGTVVFFLTFEQILPGDKFGEVMLQNLHSRNIDIPGIFAYPDLISQQQRYRNFNFEMSHSIDMFTLFKDFVSSEEKSRLDKIEKLDEVEEWDLLSKHYCISWGSIGCDVRLQIE